MAGSESCVSFSRILVVPLDRGYLSTPHDGVLAYQNTMVMEKAKTRHCYLSLWAKKTARLQHLRHYLARCAIFRRHRVEC